MKASLPKQLALALLLMASAAGPTMARGGHPMHGGRPQNAEVQAYYQANVLPVLLQQRQKLELQLSAEDRAQLATYRAQLRTLKEQGETLRRSIHPGGGEPQAGFRPELTEAQHEQLHQLRSQTRTIMMSVGQMAQKYHDALAQLAQETQPQKEKWSADVQAIVAKSISQEQPHPVEMAGRMPMHGPDHGPMHAFRGQEAMPRFFRATSFLLLEPTAPASTPEHSLSSTSFYPNPVTATSQFEYELKAAGPVTVDLLDKDGNKLRTLVAEANADKGTHTQQLILNDLPAGTYYYKVTTKGDSQTKRFVKE
ncbi:T9SS type A sorting domain-containing protein [Hymenobacter rubidus]|uniref:T9SS type A sorting domain-containing protein n=1 Tax=Hymenobacter rubidus TaxID=1441626 RepID=UPI00191F9871|nr:T9SS type A sorting domain-containing protein [Hymenobacter rubidus]